MSGTPTRERQLLFGLLACQNEFVSHSQLMNAYRAWLAAQSKPLDEVLVDEGALSPQDRELFDRLVDKHIAKFDGDTGEALSHLSSVDSIREDLERIAASDTEARKTLSLLTQSHVHESAYGTLMQSEFGTIVQQPGAGGMPPLPAVPSGPSRFRIVRQHARGGLGVVFVAEDQSLRREVAMKQIRDDRADEVGYRHKFVQEAEITGQLEHPGIVPIYALGTDAKGRPYYAMRFIRGEDLQSRIRSFHARRASNKTELDGPELRGLLRRFLDVCNAIQYAHERGVLHRDLKPGNVMLGKHGETLVVDWGLAKPFGRGSEQAQPSSSTTEPRPQPIERSASADGTETRDGSFIGSPAYAPPEQALGQLDKLGPRSDVYSLGGILYELLTGKVPVSGTSVKEVITNATTGNFPPPRIVDSQIPRPLEAICRKAMAVRLEDRYESAEKLRTEVENWLDDSSVSAYSEPLLARLHRLVRKNPVAASWVAAVVLMGLLGAVGFAAISSNHNRALSRKNVLIAAEKAAAEQARDDEKVAKDAAVVARTQAVGVRDFIVDIFRQPDPSRDGRKVTVYDSMVAGVLRVRRDFSNDPETEIALLTSIYESYTGLGLYKEANELILEVEGLRKQNQLDKTDDGLRNRNDLGENLKQLGKYAQSIKTHEDLYQECTDTRGEKAPLTLQVKHDLANAFRASGRLQDALKANEEVLQLRTEVLSENDPDILSSQNTLANALQAVGRRQDALALRQTNFDLRKKVLGSNHPDTLSSQCNLAISLLEVGRIDESLKLHTAAFEARKTLLGLDHPDTLASLFNFANVLLELGRSDDAEKMYVDAIEGLRQSLSPSHPSTLAAQAGLGRILEQQGNYERAVSVLQQVYDTHSESLGSEHPSTLASLNSLASAYERIGNASVAKAMLETAVDSAKDVLGETHEITVDLQLTLEVVYFSNGDIDKGLELCVALAPIASEAFGSAHPKSLMARSNLALAYYVIGDLPQALAIYQELEVTQSNALGTGHPETIRTELGSLNALRDMNRIDEALTRAEQTLTKARSALGNDNALTLDVVNTLGYFYMISNRLTDAKEMFREEHKSRLDKYGIDSPSTVLAGSYLLTACEQLNDWPNVLSVAEEFAAALSGSETLSNIGKDFLFRQGYAMSKLGQSSQSAEELMTSSFRSIEALAQPPAPPQLSAEQMQARLHEFYLAQGNEEEAKRYASDREPPKTIQ